MLILMIIMGICVAAAVGALALSAWEQQQLTVTRYTIKNPVFYKNQQRETILVLTDLHNHVFGKDNALLLEKIQQLHPAAILIAGDWITAHPGASMEAAMKLLEQLAGCYKIYYGVGNHEYRLKLYPETYGDMYNRLVSRIEKMGINLMENTDEVLQLGQVSVQVVGSMIDRKYYKRFANTKMENNYLKELLPPKVPDAYTILLAHNPVYFENYMAWGADLVLAGHLHGGIVRIAGKGIVSANFRLFPKYSAGRFYYGSRQMLVSRGLGVHTIPFRLFNKPEMLVVEFAGDKMNPV